MVMHAQIVELWVCEEMVLQEAFREGGVRLSACDADERNQGALNMVQGSLVSLIRGLSRRNGDVVLRRWGSELLSYATESIDRDAVEDWGGNDDVFLDGFSMLPWGGWNCGVHWARGNGDDARIAAVGVGVCSLGSSADD